jgi:alpha-L-rhamnosidase
MNSFNHYAYGAIGDWMYREIAGIDTYDSGAGYKIIKIMPHIGGNLTNASADLQTYYGNISSHWKTDKGVLRLDVEIPVNTTAIVYIPAKTPESVMENGKALSMNSTIKIMGNEGEYVKVAVGSGIYHFVASGL